MHTAIKIHYKRAIKIYSFACVGDQGVSSVLFLGIKDTSRNNKQADFLFFRFAQKAGTGLLFRFEQKTKKQEAKRFLLFAFLFSPKNENTTPYCLSLRTSKPANKVSFKIKVLAFKIRFLLWQAWRNRLPPYGPIPN